MRLAVLLGLLTACPAIAEITGASYEMPTNVYGHGVVPGGEFAGLEVTIDGTRTIGTSPLGAQAVYEDTAPRLADMDGDGSPELITVISYFDHGAAIRVWDEIPSDENPNNSSLVVLAEGTPIGTRHRWLAIVGAADLDGDGTVEIAYVDRPHLAKTLRVVRIEGDEMLEEVAVGGVTNHRIGETDIAGGIRNCNGKPEMIVASADWSALLAITYDGVSLNARRIGTDTSRPAFAAAINCR